MLRLMPPSRPVRACAALLVLGASLCARARADGQVLHEFLADVDPNEATIKLIRARGESPPVVYDGELIEAPDPADTGEVPVMTGRGGDGEGREGTGQRSPSFRPDRLTQLEGTLPYYSAFNPVVAPFKRVTSLDAVQLASDGRTPVLTVARVERRPVAVEALDAPTADPRARDRFWGEVELDFGDGRAVPLPTVAPDGRLLEVRTRPEVELSVEKDGADNYFAVLHGQRPGTSVRMVYLLDAPRSYFGTEIPTVPVGALSNRVPPMPAALRARALRFAADTLGLSTDSDLRTAVHALTGHFRAFEESAQPPADTGDIYLDLARGMRGICRHRTYAFVITAQALGIPARFVQNEAHSFVEIALPQRGFMRIDLGGAAQGVTAHGAHDRPLYRPAEPDRLPRPPAYERSYSLAAQGVSGLRPQVAEAPSGSWLPPGEALSQWQSAASDGQRRPAPPPSPPSRSAPVMAGRAPMRLSLARTRSVAQRGHPVTIGGTLQDPRGLPLSGMRVEVSLAAAQGDATLLLGVTVTDADGAFRAELGLPPDLPLGDYRLVVVAPGDAQHMPAIAE